MEELQGMGCARRLYYIVCEAGGACGSRFFSSSATESPNGGEKGSRGGGDSSASLPDFDSFWSRCTERYSRDISILIKYLKYEILKFVKLQFDV